MRLLEQGQQDRTELTVELEVDPDFFIVPKLLKEKLIEITTATVNNLEDRAQAMAAREN